MRVAEPTHIALLPFSLSLIVTGYVDPRYREEFGDVEREYVRVNPEEHAPATVYDGIFP